MGISYSAELRFGIVFPEDYVYEHYDSLGANLEQDSEWQQYEYPSEALEAHVERLTEGTNLCLVTVGYFYGEETERYLLALESPVVKTGGRDDYVTAAFKPSILDAGSGWAHPGGIAVAKKLCLDWTKASWLLCWSVG